MHRLLIHTKSQEILDRYLHIRLVNLPLCAGIGVISKRILLQPFANQTLLLLIKDMTTCHSLFKNYPRNGCFHVAG